MSFFMKKKKASRKSYAQTLDESTDEEVQEIPNGGRTPRKFNTEGQIPRKMMEQRQSVHKSQREGFSDNRGHQSLQGNHSNRSHGKNTFRQRKSNDSQEVEDEKEEDEPGIPANWAELQSRQRRFTYHTRPDLHKHTDSVEEVEERSDEEPWFDILAERLERMKEVVDEAARVEESDDESTDSEGALQREKMADDKRRNNRPGRFTLPDDCRMYGYLYKRGGVRKNWKKRFFYLDPRTVALSYYTSHRMDNVKGVISLANSRVRVEPSRMSHSNKNIQPELEFSLQEGDTFRSFGRKYKLCAINIEEFGRWVSVLERVDQLRSEFKRLGPHRKGANAEEDIGEDLEIQKWDEAQNWTAYGRGLYEGRIGEPVSFTIQPNDRFGNPLEESQDESKLSVVLESDDLHYDIPVVANEDGTFRAEYVPTKLGQYELSIMLDGFDIYGSPYAPAILSAGVSTPHCVADGIGLLCAVLDRPNEFTVYCRNEFDEPVTPTSDTELKVYLEAPLSLDSVTNNEDGTFKVLYSVACSKQELQKLQTENKCLSGSITVTYDDGKSKLGFMRQISKSPFSPGISASLSPEDLAAAYTASEFSKILQQGGNIRDMDLKNPFIAFSNLLKSKGLLEFHGNKEAPAKIEDGSEKIVLEEKTPDPQPPLKPNTPTADKPPPPPPSSATTASYFQFSASNVTPQSYFQQHQSIPPQPTNQSWNTVIAQEQGWVPHPGEADLVRASLEERAKEIEREKQELLEKRKELDASRALVEEQARQMAQLGKHRGATTPTEEEPRAAPKTNSQTKVSNLDHSLVALYDKHSVVLSRVFEYYRNQNKNGIALEDLINLCQDYDITPTFISRKEIRELFMEITGIDAAMRYEQFIEILTNIAIYSLSKPMFAHLYSTNLSKVNVLLTMWGVADPIKLSEIQQEHLT
mmetsp:Transcript_24723/g.40104  ORF Transcript_24723/g.40104 Transcript_24723/m.40104 type:complete len:922 (-) Transcript_24723:1492-4257(-)